jgi:COPII coat assembly protein SEC16
VLRSLEGEWLDENTGIPILKKSLPTDQINPLETEQLLQEIQTLLESGQQRQAFDIAMENSLWSHALIIGNILGSQFYGQALIKFVNETLSEQSSLRATYELFAGQKSTQPSSSLMKKWKNNICLILGNPSAQSASLIGQLGDTLWANYRKNISAHICYILAGVKLQPYHGNSRVVLLGADHKRSARFVNPLAILRTELYEYILASQESAIKSPAFQRYKFILAMWMADFGLVDRAQKYLDQIQQTIKYEILI